MKIPASDTLSRFNHLAGEIDSVYHDAALRFGISDSAFQIIYTLYSEGGSCLIGDICAFSGMSKQTVNSALRKLEKDGIVILAHYDGKKKNVIFTDSGVAFAADTVARVIDTENRIFSGWGEENAELYINLTKKYLDEFRRDIKEILKTK